MTLYKLEFEMKNGNFDYIESRNEWEYNNG